MFQQINIKYRKLSHIYGAFWAPIYLIYFIVHKILEQVYIYIIVNRYPIDNTIVIFRSLPEYADNARALVEYMVQNGYSSRYKLYFDVDCPRNYSDKNTGITFFSCVKKSGLYRMRYLKLIYTAGFLLFTHKPILRKSDARNGQMLVNLWHGCGYKERSKFQRVGHAPYDIALAPGKLFIEPMSHFWNIEKQNIISLGYPRYDWLKVKDPLAQELFNSYKINKESKVVLWMPTYRDDKSGVYADSASITQFPLIDEVDRWYELDGFCTEHNVVLIVKLHPFQKEYDIPFGKLNSIKEIDDSVFENSDVPMYKFIGLTDALISDYSSVAVDYLIVNRPIAFTLDDFEEYRKTRGFVFEDPRIYMPGHHLYSFQDLKEFLLDITTSRDEYRNQRKQMYGEAISFSDNYCKTILDKLSIK